MSEGVLGRDRRREGDKVAQHSSPKPDPTGSYASPINISKEAAVDLRGPKPDPNYDEEMESQEIYHNPKEWYTSKRKKLKVIGGRREKRRGREMG